MDVTRVAAPARIVQANEVRSTRIESLRALAALGVLVSHVFGLSFGFGGGTFGDRFVLAGGYGVVLFFALTGYLLFLPFARRDYGDGSRAIHLLTYARNRALRILPLYYVVLVVLLLANEGGGDTSHWLRFATFTQSFFTDTVAAVDAPMWSLVVEVQFYVLLPLFAAMLVRASRGSTAVAAALVASLALASLAFWWHNVHPYPHAGDLRLRYSLPATFLCFTPGMLLALARAQLERMQTRPRLPSAGLLLLSSTPVWLLAVYRDAWAEPLCAIGSALVLAAVALPVSEGRLVRSLDWRPLAALGLASYSLYLWHLPLVKSLDRHTDVGFVALLALAVAVSIGVASASYLIVERPFLRLRRRWVPTAADPREPQTPDATAEARAGLNA
jgi:peptidoglycan/LPS O-acetylase OafA/YrhL